MLEPEGNKIQFMNSYSGKTINWLCLRNISNSIKQKVMPYMFYYVLAAFGMWFYFSTDFSAAALALSIFFTFFCWLARFMQPKRMIIGYICACIGMGALLGGMYLYTKDKVFVMAIGFYIPILVQFLFRDFVFPNLIGIIVALIFFYRRIYESLHETVGTMIGVISVSILYSIIAYLLKKVTVERDRFHKLSTLDHLTGLYNLAYMIEQGQKMLDKGIEVTLIVADIDHFKQINDTYGHSVGNQALIFFADILRKAVQGVDCTIGRLGGDEFVILLQNLSMKQEPMVVDKLYDFLSRNPFHADSDISPLKLSCSIGVADSSEQMNCKIEKLLHIADIKMYENKYEQYRIDPELEHKKYVLPKHCIEVLGALQEKDMYTYIHSQYVAQYAELLGRALGLPNAVIKDLYIAGWMHDIGKLFISSDILRKPGKLTHEEYDTVKRHVIYGKHTLDLFNVSDTVKSAVKCHHERWDGLGYPFGFAKGEIPLEGRILALADVFSALTIKRVYMKKLSFEDAISEIRFHSGKQFDPELVKVFTGLLEEKKSEDTQYSSRVGVK